MNALDINQCKFQQEIKLFKEILAPTPVKWNYLVQKQHEVEKELMKTSVSSRQPIERVLLTAICGELKTKEQQAEFVSRLLLLGILLE